MTEQEPKQGIALSPAVQQKPDPKAARAQLVTFPKFPNLQAAAGSTVPIVTTLLAAISAAVLVVPLSYDAATTSICAGPLTMESSQAATILGAMSTAFFVLATMHSVYAQAQNFDALPEDLREAFINDHGLDSRRDVVRASYREATLDSYLLTWFWWQIGLVPLTLTVGLLAMPRVAWMGAAAAFVGVAASAFAVSKFGRWQRGVALVAFLACLALLVATLNSLLGACS